MSGTDQKHYTIADLEKVSLDLLYAEVIKADRVDAHGDPCKRACAIMCATPIECDHGRSVCDICDICSCGKCLCP